MAGSPKIDDGEALQRLNATWNAAKAELSRLREEIRRLTELGKAQESLAQVRSEREVALSRLGEQVLQLIESRSLVPPAGLQGALAEVKARDSDLARRQREVAAALGQPEGQK